MTQLRTRPVLYVLGCFVVANALCTACFADTLFYNGDPYGNGPAFLNQSNFEAPNVTQYTEFSVPLGAQWNVSGIFANTLYNLDNNAPLNSPPNTQAYYEIRSGVSNGNGGTLLASGAASAVPALMGFSSPGYDGFKIEAGFSPVQLTAGTYWVSIVPIGNHDDLAFIYNTQGANGVNALSNQQSFFSVSGGTQFGLTSVNESVGVLGQSATTPMPSTLVMSLTLCGIFGTVWTCQRAKHRTQHPMP